MSTPAPSSLLSNSLSALGLTAKTLFFSLNFDFSPPKPEGKSKMKRFKQNQGALDIDIACVLYDEHCTIDDIVWFKQLRDKTNKENQSDNFHKTTFHTCHYHASNNVHKHEHGRRNTYNFTRPKFSCCNHL